MGNARQMVIQQSVSKAKNTPVKDETVIIAADTVILFNGMTMGKPRNQQEARRILEMINGKKHTALTGFTIFDTVSGKKYSEAVETSVFMKPMTTTEIEVYVDTGEPMDKAGAYAIQGMGAVFIERIDGEYSNVVGLPLCALANALLKEFGIDVFDSTRNIVQNENDNGKWDLIGDPEGI